VTIGETIESKICGTTLEEAVSIVVKLFIKILTVYLALFNR
jgi:hypothetical protein